MYCPECKSENSDSAKFCKKCGKPLNSATVSHDKVIDNLSKGSGGNDNTKIIIIALVIIAIVLAAVFVYIGFGNNATDSQSSQAQSASDSNQVQEDDDDDSDDKAKQATQTSSSKPASKPSIKIKGGSFSTGSELEDKTYASINVGTEHAGEDVTVQIWYSRDGSTLNNGNMVPATVHSDGYLEIASADAYKYYPDYATINIYDSSGSNLLDTQSVSLSPTSGTQSF